MNREQVRSTIERERVSAIIRTQDQQLAHDAMQAAVDGGFRLIEFTLTTPGALELVTDFTKKTDIIVGAGTVMSSQQAKQAVDAGARFLVSPIVDPVVIAQAAELDVVFIPGAYTPTEMETAYRLGADYIKVFPEPTGGVGFIEAIRGPLPHLRLFPTAGVTSDNVIDYLSAGCAGAGFVKSLFVPSDLSDLNFDAICNRAKIIIDQVIQWNNNSK